MAFWWGLCDRRFLYKKEFEFLPTFKLWLASNHRPQVSSDDDAIWERIRQIPFEQTIPKEERDPGIKAELSDPEHSGAAILAWAVEGCLLWQREDLHAESKARHNILYIRAE